MNTDDFEKRLQREPLRSPPAAWREDILSAARSRIPAPDAGAGAGLLAGWRLWWSRFPVAWGAVAAIWLFVAKVLKISSLSALISMALAPLIVWFFWPEPVLVGAQVLISALLFWRHRSNIHNLLSGKEGQIVNKGDASE